MEVARKVSVLCLACHCVYVCVCVCVCVCVYSVQEIFSMGKADSHKSVPNYLSCLAFIDPKVD